jgi:Fe2+ transport system protein FeoA
MHLPLSQAPYDQPLIFGHVGDMQLSRRLQRLGISRGDVIMRMNEETRAFPLRVRTPKGEVVLAPGMASKIIVHHDNGHKTPVSEMLPGEEGHVEGLVCCSLLEYGLQILGLRENARLGMLRHIPPMDYIALAEGVRLSLPESIAVKLWGTAKGQEMQFAVAGRGIPFNITAHLGGARSSAILQRMGLVPGRLISLESVRPAPSCGARSSEQNVLQTHSGLRLHLRPDQEAEVMVEVR